MKNIKLSILTGLAFLAFQVKAQFPSANFNVNYGYLYGSNSPYNNADDDFAGWVHDGNGIVYILHANKTIDQTQSNPVITKMRLSDGTILWAKKYGNDSRGEKLFDPGANGITQGGAGSRNIAIDSNGDIYFTCSILDDFYRPYVAKVSPTDGSIIWQKSWKNANNQLAASEAISYAIDVQGGKVFLAGTTSDNKILLLVYDASSGNHLTTATIDPYSGGDKAYAVKAANNGADVYVAGWTGKNFQDAFVAKLGNSGTSLTWFNYIDVPAASRINDIDLDDNGNIYLCTDIRGGTTYFQVLKFNPNGQLIWARNYGSNGSSDRYNGMNVDVIGNRVYLTGRAGLQDNSTWVDNSGGDGMIVVFDTDGNYITNYYYFTGTNISVQASDWVKGVISYNNEMYFGGNIYTKQSNYTGNWYIAPNHSVNATVNITQSTNETFSTSFNGFDAGLTCAVADFTGYVKEDITNANGTTFGSTQVYLWKVTPTTSNRSNSFEQINVFSVFPNPASDKVFVLGPKESDNFQVNILDITGKVVKSENMNNANKRSVEISDLTRGVYMLQIQDGNHLEVHKLVIQ